MDNASVQLDMSVDITGGEASASENGGAGDDVLAYMQHIELGEWWYDLSLLHSHLSVSYRWSTSTAFHCRAHQKAFVLRNLTVPQLDP